MPDPSGEYAAAKTTSPWPASTVSCAPSCASQIRAVPSSNAVTICRPSGEVAHQAHNADKGTARRLSANESA